MGEQITYSISEAVSENTAGNDLEYYGKQAFDAVIQHKMGVKPRTRLFATMARLNALYMVSRAGSGHIGSSFSSLDILSWLYLNVLKPEDRFFSSKGHDSPGLYAVHTALGIVPFDRIHTLRRLGGLPGHPDVHTPGAVTNTGSLGMGISKAKGFLFADNLLNKPKGRVFVLTGDGELQEGQFWESLVTAAYRNDSRLVVIVDHNKVQSDTLVSSVSDLGDLVSKFKAFGWDTHRIDGHDLDAIERVLSPSSSGKPVIILADTVKGKGVSFMEHTFSNAEYYKYHSGAPVRDEYLKAVAELTENVASQSDEAGITLPAKSGASFDPVVQPQQPERMIPAYTEAILKEAAAHKNLVALDADLILDTGLIPFKEKFPDRFIECGIAEQDMVSQAGTMALGGLIPVVHSFACFLTARASEQIYNNCTQARKVIYVGSLAGVLPAGPGHSHQAVRDVANMASMPDLTVLEPFTSGQVKEAFAWAVNDTDKSSYLRLTSIPYTRRPEYDKLSPMKYGQGHVLAAGTDAVVVSNGPILTNEVLIAAEMLAQQGIKIQVVGMPWLNTIDIAWFKQNVVSNVPLITLENHYVSYGTGNWLVATLAQHGFKFGSVLSLGVTGVPMGGRNPEVLNAYGLNAEGLTKKISEFVQS
jgi:transketolase